MRFDRLDVYRAAIQYVGVTRPLVLRLRRQDPIMYDQLHRALISIPCNTAEGSGEFSPGDKAKLFRYALRSTTETIALIDTAHEIGLCAGEEHRRCIELGDRVVAMLTKLVLSVNARPHAAPKARGAARTAGTPTQT
jgi:four helix bundle protein